MIRPTGSWVAIPTPFTADEKVDFPGFETLIDFQIEHGTQGILLMGSTGESPSLTPSEKHEIMDRTLPYVGKRVPVFVGTTASTTRETIERSRYAWSAGADGLLLVVPPYLRPPQEGIYAHFRAVAEAVDLPIALYNNPSRVGVNIDAETIVRLAEIENIVADKEAMGNVDQLVQVKREAGGKINLLCCDYPGYGLILPTLALGGDGTANIAGNVIPEEMAALSRPWQTMEDVGRTRSTYFTYLPLISALYGASNPIAVKAALEILGLPGGPCRRPLPPMRPDKREALARVMDELGVTAKYGARARRPA